MIFFLYIYINFQQCVAMAVRQNENDVGMKGRNKKAKRNDREKKSSPAVCACGEPTEMTVPDGKTDMALCQIDGDIKCWCQKTKRALLAM